MSSSEQSSPAAPPAGTEWLHRRVAAVAWKVLGPLIGLFVVALIFGVIFPIFYPLVHSHLSPQRQLNLPRGTLSERLLKNNGFLNSERGKLIVNQTAEVAMGALGMTVIIISAGIDLSVGSILALCSVMLAYLLNKIGLNPWLAVGLTVLVGIACGAVNGGLVTGLRLVPFIVTLGTMLVFRGVANWISNQQKIQAAEESPRWLENLMSIPPPNSWHLISNGAWMVVILAIVVALVLRYTVFGRYVYAIGSNEATARLCGVNVPLVKIAVYSIGGLFMALAGIFDFNYLGLQGDPTGGDGMELKVIAAVVIGGGSLSGGRGSILGSIIGALTMTALASGCVFAGVSDPIQKMIIGGIIIAAVAIDQYTHRRRG